MPEEKNFKWVSIGLLLLFLSTSGCRLSSPYSQKPKSPETSFVASPTSTPTWQTATPIASVYPGTDCGYWQAPLTSRTTLPKEFTELYLDDAIQMALSNGEVLRHLGANLVAQPEAAATKLDPALRSSDPNYGLQSALANFDTQLRSSLTYEKNDEVFNNRFLGGNASEVLEGNTRSSLGLNKITATGTEFSVLSNLHHQTTSNPTLLFDRTWTTSWEARMRQPLLRGRGIRINQIAGPNYQPGFRITTGVLLARINRDMSVTAFEKAVTATVRDVISAYWQLEFAYRNYEAIQNMRDLAQKSHELVKTRSDHHIAGGEAGKELLARELHLEMQMQLTSALSGSRTPNGPPGILQSEANLRRLMGMDQFDGTLLRPVNHPSDAQIVHDWDSLVANAIQSRPEIREQALKLNKASLELEASRNYALPQLDAIALYRNNGFGNDLFGGSTRFSSAFDDALSNDHGEYEVGFTYEQPLGQRRARTAIQHYQHAYRREQTLLREMQSQIVHELGNALRQTDLESTNLDLGMQRLETMRQALQAKLHELDASRIPIEDYAETHRKLLALELEHHRQKMAYQSAMEDLMHESGRLLAEHQVQLQEE